VPDRLRLVDLVARGSLLVSDGYRTRGDELGRPGIPVLRVAEVQQGHLTPTYGDHVLESYRPKIADKVSRPRDVVVTTKGTVGRVALISDNDSEFVYSPQVCFFRCLDDTIDPRWLYYWFRGPEFTGQASGVQAQTDMAAYINLADMRGMRVTLPGIGEQRAVSASLGALDHKIESNRRLLRLSTELITASVRSAAADVSATAIPTAALARFVNGGAYTKDATRTGRMVLRIAELNSGPGGSTVYTAREVPEDQTARAGDLLMSWSGSLDIYRWTRDEAIINQHIFKVIPKNLPVWLVNDRLKAVMPIFQAIAKDKATTMGHIQRCHLESTTVPMPSSEQVALLDASLGPLWDRLLLAEREIHTLAALRDALLPELLSGASAYRRRAKPSTRRSPNESAGRRLRL